MKLLKGVLVLAAASLIMAGAAQAKVVKIGVVLVYSGGAAQFGDQIQKGMDLYMSLHAGELGGHEIELIKRDSKNPGGDVAKQVVQELIVNDNVDLLAGFVFSRTRCRSHRCSPNRKHRPSS